jgi:hypothetical protein
MKIRLLVCLVGFVLAAPADASTLITRGALDIRLSVNSRGMAVVTYRQAGVRKHVLAWGAINDDVKFKLDYSGGWGTFRRPVWKSIKACGTYDGPTLHWLVAACKAPDGSYWALQRWQRMLPNQGYPPRTGLQRARELHLSHWRGELPKLEIYLDWIYSGRYHHLFGRYTYLPINVDVNSARSVRAQHLSRRVQLGLRAGLEAGELVPRQQAARQLLLRLLPAAELLRPHAQAGRPREALPGDGDRTRRRARRLLDGRRTRGL